MREYVERLQGMSDLEIAQEWNRVWYDHRRGVPVGVKLDALRDVIVDRFVKRAYQEGTAHGMDNA